MLTTSTLFPNVKSFSHFLTNKSFGRPRSPRCDGSLTRPCSQLTHATKNITSLAEAKIVVIMIMNYLQQDGATREAELHAVLWGIVPREELQVLYGAVGQWCLHVTGGLGRREGKSKRILVCHCLTFTVHIVYLNKAGGEKGIYFLLPVSWKDKKKHIPG